MIQGQDIYIGSDSGGTMTDTFVLDREGNFIIGKASTTPRNESIGYWESLKDAFEYWGHDLDRDAQNLIPAGKRSRSWDRSSHMP